MAPRKKNAAIKSTGSTSSKAEPLPDWVKNKNIAKPPPQYQQQRQDDKSRSSTAASGSVSGASWSSKNGAGIVDKSKEHASQQADPPSRPPPLFPPGTKTPINLLNERIQKHHAPKGWLRPIIEPRRARARDAPSSSQSDDLDNDEHAETDKGHEELWTFVVTLTKTNKSDQSNPFTIRMDSRDFSGHEGSYIALDSKEKAKHWGATYALFRLCSNLSLDAMLPSGPREYWRTLASHKSKAPEHLNWLWAADPFEAQQKLKAEKEAKEVVREKKLAEAENGPRLSKAWLRAPEVRMAKALREMVEQTVREALQVFPIDDKSDGGAIDSEPATPGTSTPISVVDEEQLMKKLASLGFRAGHARSAIKWLTLARKGQSSSSLGASLQSIANLSDLDACLEYLAIFCPEEDLPSAFGPSRKADSFVTQAASAQGDGLALRWIEDRLVKLAGFPRKAVSETLTKLQDVKLESRESLCIDVLLLKLAQARQDTFAKRIAMQNDVAAAKRGHRADERMTLEAVLGPERVIDVSPNDRPFCSTERPASETYDIIISHTPKEDLRIRVCPGDMSAYPAEDEDALPTFYVASTTLPAYIRLALTQRLMKALVGLEQGYSDWREMISAGQGGVLLSMVEELESCWQRIVEDPPELSFVMSGFTLAKTSQLQHDSNELATPKRDTKKIKQMRTARQLKSDAATNERLKAEQASLWQSPSYENMKAIRMSLPAMASHSDMIRLMQNNRLLVIVGETGCGKTTQCPQIVLDNMIENGRGSLCNIVVTQPRRLSAMGVASRVSAERCEVLDGSGQVGYSIRGESKSGKNTRLLFTTTGVLLRRLSTNDPDLLGVSHVFVDEVHERGVDSDLLLLELREVLKRNHNLRVILMSATIERETFVKYFDGAPAMDIPGRTFPVAEFFLEDVKQMLNQTREDEDEDEGDGKRKRGSIDYDLVGRTVAMIIKRARNKGDDDGGILVFAPGVGEIRQAVEAIQRYADSSNHILPLHANLTSDEQRRVFTKPASGKRKIVVSTNVAETSITIDDIVYVVDLGLVKETRYDSQSGLTRLVETRCSQAAARQRRGRAGRVRPGECFRLYTRGTEQYRMDPQQVPEMMRMSLENLILTVKALKGDNISIGAYLAKAVSPPGTDAIASAVQLLSDMSVLVEGERLTALGKHLSLLPLDVRLGKLLVLGSIFHCLTPMLNAAAILSSKPLFTAPFEKREEASNARRKFLVANSDILTDVNAYQQWADLRKSGAASSATRQWCEENFISQSALRDIASVRTDLVGHLYEMGFVPTSYRPGDANVSSFDENTDDRNLQRSLLLAALYPSVVRIVHPESKFDKAIGGTVERQAEARQVRYMDASGQRVFLHPSSALFSVNKYSSEFLASFRRGASSQQNAGGTAKGTGSSDKIYLRDATETPLFSMLLFGGRLNVHRLEGGISMGPSELSGGAALAKDEGWIKMRAGGRIASLINQLRFLLDAALANSFEQPAIDAFSHGTEARVRDCLQRILKFDGQQ